MQTIHQILEEYWGHKAFRPLQEQIIQSVLDGNDTLVLLPTGGGKSICFQIPAMTQEGLCLVVSPLIALIKDQVENLKQRGIAAAAIYSGMSQREISAQLDLCQQNKVKFLYLSPERLQTKLFRLRIEQFKINLIAIDESHCISQWGYDFRPEYLRIAEIRPFFPNIPFLALTATATPAVVEDIQEKLLFKKKNVFQKSFERHNVSYSVLYEEDKFAKLVDVCNKVQGSGIVYVGSRKQTETVAGLLYRNGIRADYYHAGLTNDQRNVRQQSWIKNQTRLMVCTNAFGMGIDKPDVRLVVHLGLSSSVEAYFQEAGRCGRDEKKAFAVMLYHPTDRLYAEQQLAAKYPKIEDIRRVYAAVGTHLNVALGSGENQNYEFNLPAFAEHFKLKASLVHHAIKFLHRANYLQLIDQNNAPSRLKFLVNHHDLYRFQIANRSMDNFIQTLLRNIEGGFEDYANLNEQILAYRLQASLKKTVEGLNYLMKMELLDYVPQQNEPTIFYLTPRIDERTLYFSPEVYEQQKQRDEKLLGAMVVYVEDQHLCRSRKLLAYFGEQNEHNCGICDVCNKRKRTEISSTESALVCSQVEKILANKSLSFNELIDCIEFKNTDKLIKIIQDLLDNKTLKINKGLISI